MNSFQQPVAGEHSVGTLHLIPEENRPPGWVFGPGTSTSFTDVNFSAYVPAGVKALLLQYAVIFDGNNVADYNGYNLRKRGSTETNVYKTVSVVAGYTNLASGVKMQHYGEVTCGCDSSGYIQYRTYNGVTNHGALYLNITGYYIWWMI